MLLLTHLGLLHELLQSLGAVPLAQGRGSDLRIDAGRQHRAELVQGRLQLLYGAQQQAADVTMYLP